MKIAKKKYVRFSAGKLTDMMTISQDLKYCGGSCVFFMSSTTWNMGIAHINANVAFGLYSIFKQI